MLINNVAYVRKFDIAKQDVEYIIHKCQTLYDLFSTHKYDA